MNYKIKNININRSTLIFIMGALFVLLFLRQCSKTQELKNKVEQVQLVADRNYNNLVASQDSIRLEKNKNGELIALKNSYELEINSLTADNKKAIADYRRALNLTKDIRGINSLLKTEIKIKDSIINSMGLVTAITDSTSTIKFSDVKNWDKYNWRRFNGTVDILRNKKTNNISVISSNFNFEQGIELKAAILNYDGLNSLRITTTYPGIEFTNIENINLVNDKLNPTLQRPKNWGIGVGVGYGINLNSNQIISTGPNIGIGVFYTPNWLRF
jgi:hypothetical protein